MKFVLEVYLECKKPPHNKFFHVLLFEDLHENLKCWRVLELWGRIGNSPTANSYLVFDESKAFSMIEKRKQKEIKKGYSETQKPKSFLSDYTPNFPVFQRKIKKKKKQLPLLGSKQLKF